MKADDGPLDRASIAAPARTAIAPPDKMRETMVILLLTQLMMLFPSELDVNVLRRVWARSSSPSTRMVIPGEGVGLLENGVGMQPA